MPHVGALLAVAGSALIRMALAQDTVLASVVYTSSGDRTPYIYWSDTVMWLTPLGAQQLYEDGSFFRQRYMDDDSTKLWGLSPDIYDPAQMYLLTQDHAYSVASAQAFLQSFYPPAADDSTYLNEYMQGAFIAENSSSITSPLNGYQYPWIQTAAYSDQESIYIDGSTYCPNQQVRQAEYSESEAYKELYSSSLPFYAEVGSVLQSIRLPVESYQYYYAYSIYDYVQYMAIHNTTFYDWFQNDKVPADTMTRLKGYADLFMWATYAAGESGPTPGSVAGQTLAAKILTALSTSIDSEGTTGSLSLLFGEFVPIYSLFSLLGLQYQDVSFYGTPLPGSSMAFELITNEDPSTNFTTNYPTSDKLNVRVLFRNGTTGPLTAYTLFPKNNSNGENADSIPWSDFVAAMGSFAITEPGAWCEYCDAWTTSVFCLAWNNTALDALDGTGSKNSHGIDPKIAGVIGAVAALCLIGILLILGVGCLGLRFTRKYPSKNGGTESGLGGFKGGQKLGSDLDVSVPKNGKQGTVSVVPGPEEPIGHERVGSWELKQKEQRVSRDVSPVSFDMRQRDGDFGANPFEARPVTPRQHV